MVAKVNGVSICHTSECGGLHLPVVNRVVKQTDAIVEGFLHAKSCGAKVVHSNLTDVVGMEVDNLPIKRHRTQKSKE